MQPTTNSISQNGSSKIADQCTNINTHVKDIIGVIF
jgi:hypothetical protein